MIRTELSKLGIVLMVLSMCFSADASLTTVNVTSSSDSYIDNKYPSNNYGTANKISAGTHVNTSSKFSTTYTYDRVYVQFDWSSSNIPANAIIYSATLKLHVASTSGVAPSWYLYRVAQSWIESGTGSITASNQPALSSLSGDYVTTGQQYSNPHTFDVTSMVQRMNYGQIDNYGWCLKAQNEGYQGVALTTFYSKEETNTAVRPELEIKYYLPFSLTNVVVSHESAPNEADGGVSYTLNNGASSTFTYNWINSGGTSVGTSQSLSGVGYGWYGLEVTGVQYGEKYYMAFLIGTDCEEVTITYTTKPEYTANAYIYDRVITNGIDYKDVNYGNDKYFRTDNWNNSPWTDVKSFLQFHVWMDDAFEINQADLLLLGWIHYNSGTTNEADFNLVTESWNENLITWNASPASNTTIIETLPNTTSSTTNCTVDMTDYFNLWKQNNPTNNGILFRLQQFDDNYNTRQLYHSPNTVTPSNRPQWTFKLGLLHLDNLLYCNPEANPYVELQPKLDAGYTIAYEGMLKFTFQEAYEINPSERWSLKLFDSNHLEIASCDAIGTTSGGMSAQSYTFDDNRFTLDLSNITNATAGEFYLLEVTTQKGDQHYLKVLYQD